VDEALIERTARWLYQEQTGQGTWLPAYVPPSWQSLPRAELPTTAYAAWSLVEAGYGDAPEVRLAVEHLARYPDKAHDPYVLALVANALAAYEEMVLEKPGSEELDRVLARLAEMAQVDDDAAAWYGEIETFIGVVGDAADVERTALAVHALLRTQRHSRLAASGLAWLAEQRNGFGLWGARPTDRTALRAFLSAAQSAQSPFVTSTASVSVVESDVQSLAVRSREVGTAPHLAFDELVKGYNEVVLSAEGVGAVPYRVVGTYVLPWNQVEPSTPEEEEVSIEVGYDRTALAVGETLTATVDVMLNRPGAVRLAVLELGLPPGLEPIVHEWTEWVENGIVSGYRREGERMIVHLAGLSAEEPVRLNYRLRARFPLSVRTLPTRAYDAANPGRAVVREPVQIEVSRPEES